jgi:hypothetical protein
MARSFRLRLSARRRKTKNFVQSFQPHRPGALEKLETAVTTNLDYQKGARK